MIKKFRAYQDYKRGMKYKDIAKKYGVSLSAVKSWKSRYWRNHSRSLHKVATKKLRPKRKVATKRRGNNLDFSHLNNSNLNDRQKLFCKYYLQFYNQAKAYKLAYKCSYKVAHHDASKLMANNGVQHELNLLQRQRDEKLHINSTDIIKRLVMMFYSDVGDYINFGHKQAEDLNTGKKYQRSYVYLKNQSDVDTTPVAEIHIGKDGTQVKLPDKVKLGKLLLKYLPKPVNHNVKSDTLVRAFMIGLKNQQKS